MSILLTGAHGQVGWEVTRQVSTYGLSVLPLGHADLDITDAQAVDKAIREYSPRLVINTAAYTAVDRAEREPEQAFAVNRDGAVSLARACEASGIPLLHLSTDYVFDGSQQQAYREDDPVNPLGVYGQSKWEGEEAVRNHVSAHFILRVSWVFGVHGGNFVKTILRLAQEKAELRVVADQWGCPTAAAAIAETLLLLASKIHQGTPIAWGTYHYCGTPPTTWYGLAQAVVATAHRLTTLHVERLTPITTAEYPTTARRPTYTVLDCERIQEQFGITLPLWQEHLNEVVAASV